MPHSGSASAARRRIGYYVILADISRLSGSNASSWSNASAAGRASSEAVLNGGVSHGGSPRRYVPPLISIDASVGLNSGCARSTAASASAAPE